MLMTLRCKPSYCPGATTGEELNLMMSPNIEPQWLEHNFRVSSNTATG